MPDSTTAADSVPTYASRPKDEAARVVLYNAMAGAMIMIGMAS